MNITVTVTKVATLIKTDDAYVSRAMAALALMLFRLDDAPKASVIYFASWILGCNRNEKVVVANARKLMASRAKGKALTGKHLKHARKIALLHIGDIAGLEYRAQQDRNVREAAERAKEQRAVVDAVCASVESERWSSFVADPLPATKRSA